MSTIPRHTNDDQSELATQLFSRAVITSTDSKLTEAGSTSLNLEMLNKTLTQTDTTPNTAIPRALITSGEQLSLLVNSLLPLLNYVSVPESEDEDDWSLTEKQMLFMLQRNNFIQAALAGENENEADLETLRALSDSSEFLDLFGDMTFDEAYDRYITTLEEGRA